MMMMEIWKSVPLNDEYEHDQFKFKPAVNWFISRRTVFVTPIFDRWYWVWQPRLNVKPRQYFKIPTIQITGPAAPYNDYVSLRGKVDSVVCFGAWATFCNIMYNCLIQNFRYSKVNLLKNLTFFLRDLEIVGIMLLLRTVISLMKDKVKNVFCLRFEKRLRNIGSIPR